MNKFDAGARLVFHFAREEGEKLGHASIGPEHLLLGLLREGSTASRVLVGAGVTLDGARRLTEELTGRGTGANDEPAITPRTNRVMERAGLEVERLGSKRIRTEHILLALLGEGDGAAYRILAGLAEPEAVRRRILEAALPSEAVTVRGYSGHPARLKLAKILATTVGA
ncbi:MAG: ATP-dependent Clp protease ATP-binding subunit ClpA [uncultured Truepera sp.]|uniref:ATP-dependent Clp protease ATP-binding subunit ClpA n=1 Tax=uncultured Truepera sp. TaxID=543023 RepID=A0A6J4VMU7_9DEIN|nr:MAG: ATP-dependent Clp protease ATP-binding subunit ClpA [uncultured Truepera sp.]